MEQGRKDDLQSIGYVLDIYEGEPGPRETITPYNPALVKELNIKNELELEGG